LTSTPAMRAVLDIQLHSHVLEGEAVGTFA
jgi:hypothetical protein